MTTPYNPLYSEKEPPALVTVPLAVRFEDPAHLAALNAARQASHAYFTEGAEANGDRLERLRNAYVESLADLAQWVLSLAARELGELKDGES